MLAWLMCCPVLPDRLAHVTSFRSGAEGPIVIEHREALAYMLREAAELEHTFMCTYLFAAFSLKRSVDEGLTPEQLAAVQRWRKAILHVAKQEMLHLALAQNLLVSIGAAPHFERPRLPCSASHFPPGIRLALLPLDERALRHFLYLERPEGMAVDDAEGFAAVERAAALLAEPGEIVPHGQDFETIGHLYRAIEAGFVRLASQRGEARLFIGPPGAQATSASFGWPELRAVSDLAAASSVIETIVEQGEGARGEWKQAHFGRFHDMLDEYLALKAADPGFVPARPVLAGVVRPHPEIPDVPVIGDRATAHVADLFNVAYEVLIVVLSRFFAHSDEGPGQIAALADIAVGLMLEAIEPLGEVLTGMPFGDAKPGMNAGPTFELFYETGYLLPHREAAWLLMEERLREAAAFASRISSSSPPAVATVATALAKYADQVAEKRSG